MNAATLSCSYAQYALPNIPVRFSSSSIHAPAAEILWPGVLIDHHLNSSVQASSGATVLPHWRQIRHITSVSIG